MKMSPFWKENCRKLATFVNSDAESDINVLFGDGSPDYTFSCHFIVLALQSDVIRDEAGGYPLDKGRKVLDFTEYSQTEQATFADILIAFYKGSIEISEQNFHVLYQLCVEFKITWVKEQALVDLHTFVGMTNVLRYLQMAEVIGCKKLRAELVKFIAQTGVADYRLIMTPGEDTMFLRIL